MRDIRSQDILFWAGGNVLQRYGTLVRRTSPLAAPALVTTRASTGALIGRDGVMRQAGAGRPRVEWLDLDGDGAPETPALRLERATTNAVRNPRCEGAVIGVVGSGGALPTFWPLDTTSGLTISVEAVGTDAGLPYIDLRIQGTPTGGTVLLYFEGAAQIAAAPDEVWTGSVYARLVGGSLVGVSAVLIRIAEYQSAGGILRASQQAIDLARSRHSITATMGANTGRVRHGLSVSVTQGVPVDLTLRIGGPQLEQSPVASSLVLPPSGAPAASTRSADLLRAPWTRAPGPLAIYLRAEERGGVALPGFPNLVRLGDLGDRLQVQTDSATGRYQIRYTSGGLNRFATLPEAPAPRQRFELLLTLSADGTARLAQSIEGGPATFVTATPLALPAAWGAQTITVGGQVALRDLLVLDGSGSWTMDAARRLVG